MISLVLLPLPNNISMERVVNLIRMFMKRNIEISIVCEHF